jgi:DNA-directed RNA polymerase subunit N (RpoN/RPB10)
MFTGYFGKVKSYPKNLRYVSVVRFCSFWSGERYMPLAPTPDMLKIEDAAEYEKAYRERILEKLDPQKVYDDLGENAVILCYEKWDDVKIGKKHCHRRIIAKWLEDNIAGLSVKELRSCS